CRIAAGQRYDGSGALGSSRKGSGAGETIASIHLDRGRRKSRDGRRCWRRRGSSVERQLRDERIAPEDLQVAAECPVQSARGGWEIGGHRFAGNINVACGVQCDVRCIVHFRSTKVGGIQEICAIGVQLGKEGVSRASDCTAGANELLECIWRSWKSLGTGST